MKHLIIGTAGHVDHGKTALVKALTDIDCDTHKEEKARGITINLGFSHLNLPSGESLGIVDVPGHKDFIRTMVAGAYGIDIAMLVIAADSGIMPQTEEHLRIIEMLGVQHGIVVITKIDLVDEETAELAVLEIEEYLEGTSLETAPIVTVSSITGKGINNLLETIENIIPKIEQKDSTDVFRMYIDRIFNVKGVGFVVTGTVLEGEVNSGQEIFLLPGTSKKIKIRQIERHGGPVDKVYPGDRAALNLSGLKQDDFKRGMILAGKQLEDTTMIDASFKIFDQSTVLSTWSNVLFISGTFEASGRMHLLDKDELHPDDTGLVQIHLSRQAVLTVKDKFIIRNSSNDITIGGGTIIDTNPLHHRKRTQVLISNLQDLMQATLFSDNMVNVVKIELNKLNAPVFAAEVATSIDKSLNDILGDLEGDQGKNIRIIDSESGQILVRTDLDSKYRKLVTDELGLYHQKNPILEEGLETKELYGKFQFNKNEAGKLYLEDLMQRIHEEGTIKKVGKSWSLAQHKIVIDKKTQEELNWLEELHKGTGMDLPVANKMDALIHERRINKDRLKMLQKYLAYNGLLVFHEGTYLHQENADKAIGKLLNNIANKEGGINEKEFRELIGGTRKFVQVIIGILISRGYITKPSFYILITPKGKKSLN